MSNLVRHLREGRVAATGRLSIDRQKAREKLRKFRLADPHLWVLQLVRGASVLGASRIEFTIDADEVESVFDAPLPAEVVADLWNRGYGEDLTVGDRAGYQIALGLSAAAAMNPAEILLSSSSGAQMTAVNEQESVIAEMEDPPDGTRVYLRERFRFGHLFEFFDALDGELAEIRALRRYCRFSRLEVWVNGRRVNDSLEGRHRYRFDGEDASGLLLLHRDADDVPKPLRKPSDRLRVAISKNDVLVEVVATAAHQFAAIGTVESPTLRLDLSRLQRVTTGRDDESLKASLVYGPYHGLLAERLFQGDLSRRDERRRRILFGTVAEWSRRLSHRDIGAPAGTRELLSRLLAHPIWPRADGSGDVSVLDARTEDPEGRSALFVADEQLDEAVMEDGPILWLETAADRRAARSICGLLELEMADRTEDVWQASARGRALSRWREGAEFDEPAFVYRHQPALQGARGWIFIPIETPFSPDLTELGAVRLYIDGKLVEYRVDESVPFGMMIDGDFERTETGDVRRDEAFESVARDFVRGCTALVHRAAESRPGADHGSELYAAFFWWMRHTLDGTREVRLLTKLGIDEVAAEELADPIPSGQHDSLEAVEHVRLFRQ